MSRSNFGHIQRVSKGKYRIYWDGPPKPDGRRNQRSRTVDGTRDDAEVELARPHPGRDEGRAPVGDAARLLAAVGGADPVRPGAQDGARVPQALGEGDRAQAGGVRVDAEAGSPDSLVSLSMGHSDGTTRGRNYQKHTRRGMALVADCLTDYLLESAPCYEMLRKMLL